MTNPSLIMKNNSVSRSELNELMEFCQRLFHRHGSIDYYATVIGIGLVIVFGVLGNTGTLLTLSGRRLTTATFVYYRAIAMTDLIRCIFVLSYVLRVVIPFRHYYGATWYEAHMMYFLINTLSFISTSLAVTLCVRLCIGILQSRRLKKTKTNPKTTKFFIYFILAMAMLANCCLCFEYEAVNRIDYCVKNRTIDPQEYMIQETQFHSQNITLLTAIHIFPIIILLILICGAVSILTCCLCAMPRSTRVPPPTPRTSCNSNALLLRHCPSVRQSRPWRTQRQLCKLFLLLSLCYALGLFPEFLNMVIFSKINSCNCTSNSENYRARIKQHFDRENFASLSNIFQNIGHALSFYVYVVCSDAFRGEFLMKLRRFKTRIFSFVWPYSKTLGCTSIAGLLSEKMSQSSETKGPLKSMTFLAELETDEWVATTFAPEQILAQDDAALEMLHMETSLAAAAISYTNTPIFTLANAVRRMSTHFYHANNDTKKDQQTKPILLPSIGGSFDEKKETEIIPDKDKDIGDQSFSVPVLAIDQPTTSEILSPVQLQPHRYQRFYSTDNKRRNSTSCV